MNSNFWQRKQKILPLMSPEVLKKVLSSLEAFDKQSEAQFSKTEANIAIWVARHQFLEKVKDTPPQGQIDSKDGYEIGINVWNKILTGSYDMKKEIRGEIYLLTADYSSRLKEVISIYEDFADKVPCFQTLRDLMKQRLERMEEILRELQRMLERLESEAGQNSDFSFCMGEAIDFRNELDELFDDLFSRYLTMLEE
jgi:hypothetical protein